MNLYHAIALSAATALSTTAVGAADRALVIGIDDYASLGIQRPLQSASADAQIFAAFLQEHWNYDPAEITVLMNEQATSDAIMSVLIDKLVGETVKGDRVTFYFAGLGSRIPDRTGEEPDGLSGVLMAYDVDTLFGKIPEDAIADILDIIDDRKVTVVIDASTNGAASGVVGPMTRGDVNDTAGAASSASYAKAPFGAGKVERTIWNAAAPGQFAWETSDGGVFTQAFVAGIGESLADTNGNGTVTNAEMLGYLRQLSDEWCAATVECAVTLRGLTPNFAGRVDGIAGRQKATIAVSSTATPLTPLDGTPATYTETLGFVTDLFTPSNDAGLALNINNGSALKVGDIVSFSVDADRAGTLVLLDVNPDGELAQIYPSSLSVEGDTRMNANETLILPNALSTSGQPLQIRVSEPAGKGFLLGLFIEDDLPALKAILPADLAGGAIPNAGQYLYEIAQELLQLQANNNGTKPVQWSATYLPYEISR